MTRTKAQKARRALLRQQQGAMRWTPASTRTAPGATPRTSRGRRRSRRGTGPRLGGMYIPPSAAAFNRSSWAATGPVPEIGTIWSNTSSGRATRGVPAFGLTHEGNLAGLKALHPAHEIGPQRWPDKAATNTVVLQNTDVFNIVPHDDEKSGTWRCQIWLTPFIDAPVIVCTSKDQDGPKNPVDDANDKNTGVGPTTSKKYRVVYSTQWDYHGTDKHPSRDYQSVRLTARSVTVDLIANATSNQGIVYAGQFVGQCTLMPASGGAGVKRNRRKVDELASMFGELLELTYDETGLTPLNPDVKRLIDRLKRLRVQDPQPDPPVAPDDDGDAPVEDAQNGYRWVFTDWPVTAAELVQEDPRSYKAKAEEGCYLPLRHCQDTLPYQTTDKECWLSARVPHSGENSQTTECNVLSTDGWTYGYIIFEGLSPNAVLSFKVISALEAQPNPESTVAKFTKTAPRLDKLAIDTVREAMGSMPSAYRAADNELGTILNWVSKALAQSGIPVISTIARGVQGVNNALGGAPQRWLDQLL
ncbi:MAG: hypothetical protein FDSTV1_gp4 [Fushun diaea subdola tombus-like virus 1]|nr:MAG: hypothetical protein FDSTV1_gp4 [Fushun diaea subdola tombus-like virus 1]